MGDTGDRGKGLAPEAVGGHALEVGELAELRGGMSLEGLARVIRAHAVAVVAHADPLLAAPVDLDRDRPRLRVQRVLDQLLDHRRRPLDHFAAAILLTRSSGSLWMRLTTERRARRRA
jgi:hypothetical protein